MRGFDFLCGAVLLFLGGIKVVLPNASLDQWPDWYAHAVHAATVLEVLVGLAIATGRHRAVTSTAFLGLALAFAAFAAFVRPEQGGCGCLGALEVSRLTELSIAGGLVALAGAYMRASAAFDENVHATNVASSPSD